jgi:adenylate cyclase
MAATLAPKIDKEIERKFLVKALPPNVKRFENRRIDQGYLAVDDDRTQVRLRRAGKRCALTVKRGRGRSREEYEIELTPAQFAKLWPATAGRRLRKTRFDIPFGDHVIELDVYNGRNDGLVVAEVEFDNEKDCANFRPPSWLGAEVTGKSRYSNVKLARE